ncbi:MAG: metallophosphoesterase [Anaerolineales bacterium]|nr:metallophosphoesterase [Anaerolineales bacterium]
MKRYRVSHLRNTPRLAPRPVMPLILWMVVSLLAAACWSSTGLAPVASTTPPAGNDPLPSAMPTDPMAAAASPSPLPATAAPTPTEAPPPGTPVPDLFSQEPPISATAYLLPLTVQHVTETSATLFLELAAPASGALFYRPAGGDAGTTSTAVLLEPTQTRHQLVLENLQPGVEYQAQVGLSEGDGSLRQPAFRQAAWGAVHFRTAASQEPLRFGVFGDASFGDPATVALVERMLTYDLDFAIHTGDVVAEIQNDPSPAEAYATKFYTALSGLLHHMPIYTVIGNHDYDRPAYWQEQPFYYYAFPPFFDPAFQSTIASGARQYYAFAKQGVQFMLLDSQTFYGVPGRAEQQAWMEERLADPRFRYTIPIFHVPPFFSGSVHPQDGIPIRQTWHPLFSTSRVPLAFSGHSHHYERLFADGITYIVSGGGSSIIYAAGEILPQSQIYARRTHFVLVELYADRIELSAIDKNGELLDRWTVETPG